MRVCWHFNTLRILWAEAALVLRKSTGVNSKERLLSKGGKEKEIQWEQNVVKCIWSYRSAGTNRNGNGPTVCIYSSSRFHKRAAAAGPKHAIVVGT